MVVVVLVLMVGLSLLPAGVVRYTDRRTRAALRRCPCCGSEAVRETLRKPLTFTSSRIKLQCGQCAAWRRLEVPASAFGSHDRRVRRARRRIAADADRLCARRRRAELAAFKRALRVEIKGADDFIDRTRPPRTTA
jgi:hypothetical protein